MSNIFQIVYRSRRVCRQHFNKECLLKPFRFCRSILKQDSTPTIFPNIDSFETPDTFSSHMPPPTGGPWISEQMPWSNPTYAGIMHFTATPNFTGLNQKRKSDLDNEHPSKQHITEEKMAATLNSLHISHNFVEHNSNIATECASRFYSSSENSTEEVMDSEIESKYSLCSSKDLEEKLRRAKHISICEEFKNIKNNEPIIPKALLEHYEKPCKALVIWQPPPKIKDLISIGSSLINDNQVESEDEDDTNNNKCNSSSSSSNIDINNVTMETDMF